jgi:hypothetical protein
MASSSHLITPAPRRLPAHWSTRQIRVYTPSTSALWAGVHPEPVVGLSA